MLGGDKLPSLISHLPENICLVYTSSTLWKMGKKKSSLKKTNTYWKKLIFYCHKYFIAKEQYKNIFYLETLNSLFKLNENDVVKIDLF